MASADGSSTPAEKEMNAAPTLCAEGCGFFGNPQTGGMCSKCYKAKLAKQQTASAPAPTAETVKPPVAEETKREPPPAASCSTATPEAEAAAPAVGVVRPPEAAEDVADEPPKKVQVNTSRCWTCNRKIGLLGFQCKCEFYFCAEHRMSDRHECTFDFKEQGKKKLIKDNPTIAPSKMESIN